MGEHEYKRINLGAEHNRKACTQREKFIGDRTNLTDPKAHILGYRKLVYR